MKPIWQSKTFWLNVVGIIVTILEMQEVVNLVPADWQPAIPAVLGVLNIIVRFATKTAVTLR